MRFKEKKKANTWNTFEKRSNKFAWNLIVFFGSELWHLYVTLYVVNPWQFSYYSDLAYFYEIYREIDRVEIENVTKFIREFITSSPSPRNNHYFMQIEAIEQRIDINIVHPSSTIRCVFTEQINRRNISSPFQLPPLLHFRGILNKLETNLFILIKFKNILIHP